MTAAPVALHPSYAACRLCAHSATAGIELVCAKPELQGPNGPEPVAVQRSWGHACGPTAQHMQANYTRDARPL